MMASQSARAAPPEGGVASTALCADAYVLAIVPPDDIAALSWQSRQSVSAAPEWAQALPQARAQAETLLELGPGLAVFGAGEGGRTRPLVERADMASLVLSWGEDFDTVRENYRRLGTATEIPDIAEARIADLDQRLAELARRARQREARPRIAYLSSSGGSAGGGTFIHAAIAAAGGENVVATGGAQGWTRSDPEFALTLEADILLTSFFTDGFDGRLSRAQRHSAYNRLLSAGHRVDIPSGLWPCAGPGLIDAAEQIADAIDAWEARP